ncbi:carbamoyltransferase HypF [Shewanella avicenniae]|uniref:Carbamoyltransferase HypF n=1 Tax=Shewanella avicenniae TaxID=2814294 RepID=A0ABX7QMU5_9GAMM|nr:carbamoyltransferase HypF [Shewanella avicenniae]QSX32033.1 carbamoyltransferase HypF [Shewanella avicenniae]
MTIATPARAIQTVARRYHMQGIVQGVGFRPWIYQLALRWELVGYVLNNGEGVTVLVQGSATAINYFDQSLYQQRPPLSRIDAITHQDIEVDSSISVFAINQSETSEHAVTIVSSDKSSCPDCLAEMRDPHNRHFGYPFVNCTHCGPRYTIINKLPYDRSNTSMAAFEMCAECRAAYENPLDRRYHAQPVSCPACGPQLRYLNTKGEQQAERGEAFALTVAALKRGEILAIKGLGGFHLVCDATSDTAVNLLRQRKQRPAKPLAVMVANLDMAQAYAQGSATEWQLLTSQERPIVLLAKRDDGTTKPLSAAVAPEIDRIGLFLPYTPLHTLLLDALEFPLVATSANLSGEPIITDSSDIISQLANEPFAVVDGVLDHNRPILNGCDDSVVQVCGGEIQVLRLARGYAPLMLPSKSLSATEASLLAVGPQQKNTLALNIGNNLCLSPHIGDLFSIGAESYFKRTLASFQRLYHIEPQQIVRDLHPQYASSQWAERHEAPKLLVQHHYAHVLATLAANDYQGQVLGFSFDGTGLGDNGELWGGELLLADNQQYQRLASIEPFALIGNELAIKQPWRLAYSLLCDHFNHEQLLQLPCFAEHKISQLNNLKRVMQSGKMPLTHSIGRLFDALAVLLGLMQHTLYEGQAGILVETAARRALANDVLPYPLTLRRQADSQLALGIWQPRALFAEIVAARLAGIDVDALALGFIHALGRAVVAAAIDAQQQFSTALPVVLTGGVFQNRCLTEFCQQQFTVQGISWLPQGLVPVNDGGIALGQLWYGLHQLQTEKGSH